MPRANTATTTNNKKKNETPKKKVIREVAFSDDDPSSSAEAVEEVPGLAKEKEGGEGGISVPDGILRGGEPALPDPAHPAPEVPPAVEEPHPVPASASVKKPSAGHKRPLPERKSVPAVNDEWFQRLDDHMKRYMENRSKAKVEIVVRRGKKKPTIKVDGKEADNEEASSDSDDESTPKKKAPPKPKPRSKLPPKKRKPVSDDEEEEPSNSKKRQRVDSQRLDVGEIERQPNYVDRLYGEIFSF
jgi:hypothetical protein